MLPIVLDSDQIRFALVGAGEQLLRRYELLKAAGTAELRVFGDAPDGTIPEAVDRLPGASDLETIGVLFVAGLDRVKSVPLVAAARAQGILVNTEDDRELCDFHVPASVRRGDLLLTVSTGGHSPGLARRLRKELESRFTEEWADNVRALSAERQKWRDEGLDLKSVARKSDEYIDGKGWLK